MTGETRRKFGLRLNPVIVRELRAQMRGPRAFLIITAYLLALSGLTYGIYRLTSTTLAQNYGYASAVQSAMIGKLLFIVLAYLDLLLICFVTPALTAGALSGEHERGTYDLLVATPLSASAVFWGKFIPSMTYAFLLVLASIPTFSIAFLFGGVTIKDMVQVIVILTLSAVMLGAMTLWLSSAVRRTGRATVVAYIMVVLLLFGTMFIWALQALQANRNTGSPYTFTPYVLYLNPLSALGSAILGFGLGDMYYGFPFSLFTSAGPFNMQYAVGMKRPLWQYTMALYVMFTLVFYLLATQTIKPIRRWRFSRRELGQVALVLIAVAGLGYVTFGTTWASTGAAQGGVPTLTPVPVWREEPVEVVPPPLPVENSADPDEAQAVLESFLAAKLFPDQSALCRFSIFLGTYADTQVELEGAILCASFSVNTDGEVNIEAEERHEVKAMLLWDGTQWTLAESTLDGTDPGSLNVDWDALRRELEEKAKATFIASP